MNDDLEPRLHDWLAERGRVSDVDVRAVTDRVIALPARRRSAAWLPLAAAAAVLVAVVALGTMLPRVVAPGGAGVTPSSSVAVPPDPAAFAGDPRMVRCGVPPATAIYAIELPRARDYRQYLPRMGESPELQVDDPAFVVVFDAAHPFGVGGRSGPNPTSRPGNRDACVLVGAHVAAAVAHLYTDVDVTDLTATPPGVLEPNPTLSATIPASPSEPVQPPTPSASSPLPAWFARPSTVLECDGAVDRGPPAIELSVVDPPEQPIERLIALAWDVAIPAAGYDLPERTGDVLGYFYRVDGRVKAIVVIREPTVSSGHRVLAAPHCDPDEFDPVHGLTGSPGAWLDVNGVPLETDVLEQRNDCYQGAWIRFRGRQFVRDPLGHAYSPDQLLGTYEAGVDLPSDAVDTGYRAGLRELHVAADERAAYVVAGERVERWPRVDGDDYQRTDCN